MIDYKQYTLGELIEKELLEGKTFYDFDSKTRKAMKNFFLGNGKEKKKEIESVFCEHPSWNKKLSDPDLIESLNADVRAVCRGYSRKKDTPIRFLNAMFERLEKTISFHIMSI